MATAEQLNQAIGLIQGNQYCDAEALLTPAQPVSNGRRCMAINCSVTQRQLDLAGA